MLNERERAAVVDGLRLLQGTDQPPMPRGEIEDLCERLAEAEPGIEIPEGAWRPFGPAWNQRSHLTAEVVVNGAWFCAEAVEVQKDGNGRQVAAERTLDDELIGRHVTFAADGPFVTTSIGGREYAVFMYPQS